MACRIANVAILVLPDPVGAQTSMFSLELNAWSKTALCKVLRYSDSKHLAYTGSQKSDTLIFSMKSVFSLGRGYSLNCTYSGRSYLLRVGTFCTSSLSFILRKSTVSSSSCLSWSSHLFNCSFDYFSRLFGLSWPDYSLKFSTCCVNLLSFRIL